MRISFVHFSTPLALIAAALLFGANPAAAEGSRRPAPLTAAEERALKPKHSFKECDACPEMVVVPAGSFTMGSPPEPQFRFPDRQDASYPLSLYIFTS
jgi:formylglycine-generating enzyme required for sulfatase activity